MKFYIDDDFKCHVNASEGLREVEDKFFNGMYDKVIECYRYVPEGESWTREDGEIFEGKMITTHIDSRIMLAYKEILALQEENSEYEATLSEIEEALEI